MSCSKYPSQSRAQKREVVLVLEVARGRIVVVEPAGQRAHGQGHAVGHAEVALAHDELGARERRLHERAVEPAVGQRAQVLLDHRAEARGAVVFETAQLHDREGLQHRVGQKRLRVGRQARVEQRALERRLVRAHDGVQQDVHGHDARAFARVADDVAQPRARVLGRGDHVARHAERHHRRLLLKRVRREGRALGVEARGRGLLVGHGGEVPLVEEGQHGVRVEVAVQREVAVVQTVVAAMLLEELLVGEVGDGARRAARLEAVGRVGEQGRLQLVVQHRVRVGQGALHLVVHHAVQHEARRAVGRLGGRHGVACHGIARRGLHVAGQLVVPALLLEDGALAVDGRVQHCVEVHVGEVEQVLVVRAGHGVHRLVGERHGVQKRLHRAFQQVHERLFDGELVAAAQHGVLEDVEDAGVVGGRGFERDGERLVRVVVRQVQQLRAGLVVVEHVGGAVDFGKRFARAHGKAVQLRAGSQVHRGHTFREGMRVRMPLKLLPPLSHNRPSPESIPPPSSPLPQTTVASPFPLGLAFVSRIRREARPWASLSKGRGRSVRVARPQELPRRRSARRSCPSSWR